jgi:hypothetical protein
VNFSIQHLIALQNGRLSDSLRQVALTGATGTEKEGVFVFRDERACG